MTDAIVISAFVALLVATLVFGAWLGRRSERARQRKSLSWQSRVAAGVVGLSPALPNIANGDTE